MIPIRCTKKRSSPILTACICINTLLFMMVACKSPSDKLMDEFKKAESSLQPINDLISARDTLLRLNLSILAKLQINPALAHKADSVYLTTVTASTIIDSVINVISVQDTTGENTYITSKVMASGNCGKRLYNSLINACTLCRNSAVNPLMQAKADSINATLSAFSSYTIFEEKLIKGTPSAATRTILLKLKNDCIASALTVMQDIKNNMAKNK